MTIVDFVIVDEENNTLSELSYEILGDVLPKSGITDYRGRTKRHILRWNHVYNIIIKGFGGFLFIPAFALIEHGVIVVTGSVEQVITPNKGRMM